MPRVHASHEVKDVKHWVSSPKREEVFGPLGITEIKTYIDPQGSNRVGLTMNVPDMDAAMALMQSQEGIDAMEYDGVMPETMVLLIES
jgi:hypothetical protein